MGGWVHIARQQQNPFVEKGESALKKELDAEFNSLHPHPMVIVKAGL